VCYGCKATLGPLRKSKDAGCWQVYDEARLPRLASVEAPQLSACIHSAEQSDVPVCSWRMLKDSTAQQSRAEQSTAEQSRAQQSRAEQSRCIRSEICLLGLPSAWDADYCDRASCNVGVCMSGGCSPDSASTMRPLLHYCNHLLRVVRTWHSRSYLEELPFWANDRTAWYPNENLTRLTISVTKQNIHQQLKRFNTGRSSVRPQAYGRITQIQGSQCQYTNQRRDEKATSSTNIRPYNKAMIIQWH